MSVIHSYVTEPGRRGGGWLDGKPQVALAGENGWAGWAKKVGPDETAVNT